MNDTPRNAKRPCPNCGAEIATAAENLRPAYCPVCEWTQPENRLVCGHPAMCLGSGWFPGDDDEPYCGWCGALNIAKQMEAQRDAEERGRKAAEASLASARSDAMAYAIEAERLREALRRHGHHIGWTENEWGSICAWVRWVQRWSKEQKPPGEVAPACDCGLDVALAPAAPGDVSVREWLDKLIGAVLTASAPDGGDHADRHNRRNRRILAALDAALSSLPSPSLASRLRADALLACEKAVRAVRAWEAYWEKVHPCTGGHDCGPGRDCEAASRLLSVAQSENDAAVAALAACDKEEK